MYEGKVLVEIGTQGGEVSVNEFAITKGGVWVVPRGEFSVFFARVFAFTGWISSRGLDLDVEHGLFSKAKTGKSGGTPPLRPSIVRTMDTYESQTPGRWVRKRCVRRAVKSSLPARHRGTFQSCAHCGLPTRCSFPARLDSKSGSCDVTAGDVLVTWKRTFSGIPFADARVRCRQQLRHYEREPDEDCQDFLCAGVRGGCSCWSGAVNGRELFVLVEEHIRWLACMSEHWRVSEVILTWAYAVVRYPMMARMLL